MSECLFHGESFTTCASPTRRQWMIATVGASGALSLAAIVPFKRAVYDEVVTAFRDWLA